MEFLLAHGAYMAGDNSDSESIRSDISETFVGALFQRRPGSGRRKKQVPWRSPWDASVSTDYAPQYFHSKESLPSRLGLTNNMGSASPCMQVHSPTPTPSAPTPTGGRRKTKQDLSGPCCHCNATSSPQWRKGPKGKPILCNACGIRFLRTRTLGKAMPKKRRVAAAGGADTATHPPKRVKAEEPTTEEEELELGTDEVLATEDVLATDDGLEEAHSGLAALHHSLEHTHPHAALQTSRLAITSRAAGGCEEGTGDMEHEHASSHMSDTALLLAAAAARNAAAGTSSCSSYGLLGHVATGTHQPLAAGSRHVLLGASSRLSHNPSLALALALHQQQQQYSSCSQQQPNSPAKVGTCLAAGASASPVSNTSAYHHKLDHSDYSAASGSPPASPLMLGATSSCRVGASAAHSGVSSLMAAHQHQQMQQQQMQMHQVHMLQQQQQQQQQHVQHGPHGPSPLSLMGTADVTAAQSGAVSMPAQGDVLHLMRTMASALGGMGPAFELLKALNTSGAAAGGRSSGGGAATGAAPAVGRPLCV